ncbi:hypothetical protein [Ramlibacter sp. Leaf400]|uniref:hypothetical protein n=1 Tax=Ramlibacter sp. Leaf400 TaxID=1736365 RepID=UPI0012E351F6|nr:hypothetical protein [Ramlibacter sp. Leaf400]
MKNPEHHTPQGHPFTLLALGGFLGGIAADVVQAGFLGFAVLTLGAAFGLLAGFGHLRKGYAGWQSGTDIGLTTVLPLLTGLLGMHLGNALWG